MANPTHLLCNLMVYLLHNIPFGLGRSCLALGNVERDSTRRFTIPKQLESNRCQGLLVEYNSLEYPLTHVHWSSRGGPQDFDYSPSS
jgi:hypothetical protein